MATIRMDLKTRIEILNKLIIERDELINIRKKIDIRYIKKYGVKKDPATVRSEREIELRRLINIQRNVIYQLERREREKIISKTKENENISLLKELNRKYTEIKKLYEDAKKKKKKNLTTESDELDKFLTKLGDVITD